MMMIMMTYIINNKFQVDGDDDGNKPDNQDWSFKMTSFGWRFKRNFENSKSIPTSSGWISRAKPEVDSCTAKQTISSGISDTSEDTTVETRNFNHERMKETLNSRMEEDTKSSSMSGNRHKIHSENFTESGNRRESENDSEDKRKEKKMKYTIPILSQTIPDNDDDMFDLEDIDFSEDLEEKVSYDAGKSSQESDSIQEPYPSSLSKTQVHALALTLGQDNKPNKKKGIEYSNDPDDEVKSNEVDTKKYENILLDSRRKLKESQWIDARKMKKKIKSSTFFKV